MGHMPTLQSARSPAIRPGKWDINGTFGRAVMSGGEPAPAEPRRFHIPQNHETWQAARGNRQADHFLLTASHARLLALRRADGQSEALTQGATQLV